MIYRPTTEPPPLFARPADPETSHAAGLDATRKHPDADAATWVLHVVTDTPQTDEQLYAAAERAGCPITISRFRHGRKHAADLGLIVQAGKLPMQSGATGRAWVRNTKERA